MGERQDPQEQVKVNVSAVFSLWWRSGGCVFYINGFVWCDCGSVFKCLRLFRLRRPKNMSQKPVCLRDVSQNPDYNCVQETCPTHMSKKHFQEKPVPETR